MKRLIVVSLMVSSAAAQQEKTSYAVGPPVDRISVPPPGEQVYYAVDEPAQFPGGIFALQKYLAENLTYPTCLEQDIDTKSYIRFVVDEQGAISDAVILRASDCGECDKDALRIVQHMPYWKPATIDGKAVRSYFTLPVRFSLKAY